MKRNWDIVRYVLLEVEARKNENDQLFVSNDYSDSEIVYHLELLIEAGLINCDTVTMGGGPGSFVIDRLSWEGHQFLDAIRDDGAWKKIKKKVSESGVGMTFEVIKAVAISSAKDALGI